MQNWEGSEKKSKLNGPYLLYLTKCLLIVINLHRKHIESCPQVESKVAGGRTPDGPVDQWGQDQGPGDGRGGVREHPRCHGRSLHRGQHRQDDCQALNWRTFGNYRSYQIWGIWWPCVRYLLYHFRLPHWGSRFSVFCFKSCVFLAVWGQIWQKFLGTYDLRSS